MYVFAIAALLGLAVLALTMLVERYVARPESRELWALTLVVLGVAAAWLAGFSLWTAWGVPVRWGWVGTTLTGVALAGLAGLWHTVLSLFDGLVRKYNDEAATLEKTEGLRRVA